MKKKVFIPIITALILALVAICWIVGNAQAASYTEYSGNDNGLPGQYPQYDWVKSGEAPGVGTYTLPLKDDYTITFTIAKENGNTFVSSWYTSSENVKIKFISMKGGNGYRLYWLDGASSGGALYCPINNSGKNASISHISVGYEIVIPEQTETPTSTETLTPTPTDNPTPTETAVVTETPAPTETPVITEPPVPTETPVVTEPPVPTDNPTPTPSPTVTPTPSPTPTVTVPKMGE